ncbi:3-oxoacyl-[acyl-carrier-protein] synthase III [Cytobacillus oceanisediminis]|uniref:3-oxoacyl-[acyl-carrier-protein] synthase III n=2 Tax=Cytobacillus oceanisediminis TaxID=665099 RepID=A0A2V3A5Q5_9BACI|nr:3-oxoacyl-[acyl-carrier-protein] synthase III [Cytobacillus oceanisediminis]
MEFIGVKGTAVYQPAEMVKTDYLLKTEQISKKTFNKIGVSSVRVANHSESPTDLAIKAAKSLINESTVSLDQINIVIYVGATPPDYLIWSPSAKVCYELGLKKAIGFEVMLGCGGVPMSLKIAKDLLLNTKDWKHALIVSGENWEPYTTNRTAAGLIFGDTGAAILLEKGTNVKNKLGEFAGVTDGRFYDFAFLSSGTKFADMERQKQTAIRENEYSFFNTDSANLLRENNIKNYLYITNELLEKSKLSLSDISYLLLPSGRKDLMEKLIDVLEFDRSRTNFPFLESQGDLGAPGFICDLNNLFNIYQPRRGEKILTLSAGVGISWLGSILEV